MAWIKDNAALRASGDSDANALFEEYQGSVMSSFPFLSDKDIDDILAYTAQPAVNPATQAATTVSGEATVGDHEGEDITWFVFFLVVFIALILFILIRIKKRNPNSCNKGAEQDSR